MEFNKKEILINLKSPIDELRKESLIKIMKSKDSSFIRTVSNIQKNDSNLELRFYAKKVIELLQKENSVEPIKNTTKSHLLQVDEDDNNSKSYEEFAEFFKNISSQVYLPKLKTLNNNIIKSFNSKITEKLKKEQDKYYSAFYQYIEYLSHSDKNKELQKYTEYILNCFRNKENIDFEKILNSIKLATKNIDVNTVNITKTTTTYLKKQTSKIEPIHNIKNNNYNIKNIIGFIILIIVFLNIITAIDCYIEYQKAIKTRNICEANEKNHYLKSQKMIKKSIDNIAKEINNKRK